MLDLLDPTASVKFGPYHLVGLYELVYLPGKLIVLATHDANMVVHGVYFVLHGRVVLVQGLV